MGVYFIAVGRADNSVTQKHDMEPHHVISDYIPCKLKLVLIHNINLGLDYG